MTWIVAPLRLARLSPFTSYLGGGRSVHAFPPARLAPPDAALDARGRWGFPPNARSRMPRNRNNWRAVAVANWYGQTETVRARRGLTSLR